MKSAKWRAIRGCNQKMMDHQIKELKKTINFDTHVITASYSTTASSVRVFATPKEFQRFD